MLRECVFCLHAVPADLVRVVNDDWSHRWWQCADELWCGLRVSRNEAA